MPGPTGEFEAGGSLLQLSVPSLGLLGEAHFSGSGSSAPPRPLSSYNIGEIKVGQANNC